MHERKELGSLFIYRPAARVAGEETRHDGVMERVRWEESVCVGDALSCLFPSESSPASY